MNTQPLSGLKVVDFSRVLAGPHCSKVLLDLGADVIKVEPPGMGDISRYAAPGKMGKSHYFYQQNAGKKCVSIDLNFKEGCDLALELVRDADIVVENFRPGTLDFFGLSYEKIAKINPRTIYVSISGYGQNTSMSYRGAFAPTVHAEMGLAHTLLTHYGDALTEAKSDVFSHADVYTGLEAVIGVLAALEHRHKTGLGQHVDVSMAATMFAVNERAHADMMQEDSGPEPIALGATESPMFDFRDGSRIVISATPVFTPIFGKYCAMMRRNDLKDDPRFITPDLRRQNLKTLLNYVQEWILTFRNLQELEVQLTEAGLAVGQVRTMADFADSDWAEEWGAVVKIEDDEGTTLKVPGPPWKFSNCALETHTDARRIGEDNWEIFKAQGISREKYDALKNKGVVYSR